MMNAEEIINALRKQARSVVGAALGSANLESFTTTNKGNFPYYYKDPSTNEFNSKTYDWISSSLQPGKAPYQLGGPFTNDFIDVLGNVTYSFSTADQAKLNEAAAAATDQQGAVLRAWQAAYKKFPDGTQPPIDLIMQEIITTWAKKGTDLDALRQAINLKDLLPNMPFSGEPILGPLANYLNATQSVAPLQNAATMNAAYLRQALGAVQEPKQANGGLKLNNGKLVPAFQVANDISDILNGLKNSSQSAKLSMTVEHSSENEFKVSVSGGATFSIPVLDLFSINVGGNASYFQSELVRKGEEVTVDMEFPGVTLVNFGPSEFSMATHDNWYWEEPIREAVQNGNKDISGYKFSPMPNIELGSTGPFGYLEGVVVSNYPTIKITTNRSSYQRVQKTFEQTVSVGISFLGIPLGLQGKESTYSNKVDVNSSDSTATFTFAPPKELVAGTATDSVAWVLGVIPKHPAAS